MKQNGFTLLELMVVVVIVAIFAAIAIPSYQSYMRRNNEGQAIQEMQRISVLLERHKARNFTYKLFSLDGTNQSTNTVTLQNGYTVQVVDGSSTSNAVPLNNDNSPGQTWAIRAQTTDPQNFTLLLTSQGLRCKNQAASNVTFNTCGTGTQGW
ncbi:MULTISPECIES: type IV pilin protein [Acinetobacter]|nr:MULTISPECIES: prepilin-type N-terminal cleavage/methylation domain-containing protein [Acinetobacter]